MRFVARIGIDPRGALGSHWRRFRVLFTASVARELRTAKSPVASRADRLIDAKRLDLDRVHGRREISSLRSPLRAVWHLARVSQGKAQGVQGIQRTAFKDVLASVAAILAHFALQVDGFHVHGAAPKEERQDCPCPSVH